MSSWVVVSVCVLATLVILLVIYASTGRSSSETDLSVSVSDAPILKTSPQNVLATELVIARYEESLDWLPELYNKYQTQLTQITIYNKGRESSLSTTIRKLPRTRVIALPNVGRVDHTYVYHFHHKYQELADVTILLPGSCDMQYKWPQALSTMAHALDTRDSVFCMSSRKWLQPTFTADRYQCKNPTNAKHNPEEHTFPCPVRPFGAWFNHVFQGIVTMKDVPATVFRAMFAVSRDTVHRRNPEFYQHLLGFLNSHSNPEAGHFLERAWLAVFHPVPPQHLFPNPVHARDASLAGAVLGVVPLGATPSEVHEFVTYYTSVFGEENVALLNATGGALSVVSSFPRISVYVESIWTSAEQEQVSIQKCQQTLRQQRPSVRFIFTFHLHEFLVHVADVTAGKPWTRTRIIEELRELPIEQLAFTLQPFEMVVDTASPYYNIPHVTKPKHHVIIHYRTSTPLKPVSFVRTGASLESLTHAVPCSLGVFSFSHAGERATIDKARTVIHARQYCDVTADPRDQLLALQRLPSDHEPFWKVVRMTYERHLWTYLYLRSLPSQGSSNNIDMLRFTTTWMHEQPNPDTIVDRTLHCKYPEDVSQDDLYEELSVKVVSTLANRVVRTPYFSGSI